MMTEGKSTLFVIIISCLVLFASNIFFYRQYSSKDTQKVMKIIERRYVNMDIQEKQGTRIKFETEDIIGSINLKGLKIDNIKLKNYYETINNDQNVEILFPYGGTNQFFIDFGWISENKIDLPKSNTLWKINSLNELSQEFSYTNKDNIIFKATIHFDDKFLLRIEQEVINNSNENISVIPYGKINRSIQLDSKKKSNLIHEGALVATNGKYNEISYKEILKSKIGGKKFTVDNNTNEMSWIGISDKYWLNSIILDSKKIQNINVTHTDLKNKKDTSFEINFKGIRENVSKDGGNAKNISYVYTGAKELETVDKYTKLYKIQFFDKSIDFGIFYVITKPMLKFLQILKNLIPNFGVVIIIFTLIVKLVALPLTIKASLSGIKMQKIKPETDRIKALYKDDKLKISKEQMKLFKKHGISPFSSIIPAIIQIPIFFSLYKVLSITIEMRHAPFFLWIQDLSISDTTTIFNLFGLINWEPTGIFSSLGVLSILVGISLFLQQIINGKNLDPNMEMMKYTPIIFTFISASFPSGLAIYWIFSTVFSTIQQILIKKFYIKQ